MELAELLGAWAIGPVASVEAVGRGTNNPTYFVEAAGGRFVLRVSMGTAERLAFEHAVCQRLGELPFEIPVPVATIDGKTWAEAGSGGRARLTRAIPGEHPRRESVVQAEVCGRALAQLDLALGELAAKDLPPMPEWNADFTTVHPRVRSLPQFFDLLPIDGRDAARDLFDRIAKTFEDCDLPRQVIHADFGVSNVLMSGDRVTGILDLEFACPGYRAMDLATGLWSFSKNDQTTEAFRHGYLAELPLTDAELNALPNLQRLREATGLVHRVGRHLDGHTPTVELADRLTRLLDLDAALPSGRLG